VYPIGANLGGLLEPCTGGWTMGARASDSPAQRETQRSSRCGGPGGRVQQPLPQALVARADHGLAAAEPPLAALDQAVAQRQRRSIQHLQSRKHRSRWCCAGLASLGMKTPAGGCQTGNECPIPNANSILYRSNSILLISVMFLGVPVAGLVIMFLGPERCAKAAAG
jgi:hypothetical protein